MRVCCTAMMGLLLGVCEMAPLFAMWDFVLDYDIQGNDKFGVRVICTHPDLPRDERFLALTKNCPLFQIRHEAREDPDPFAYYTFILTILDEDGRALFRPLKCFKRYEENPPTRRTTLKVSGRYNSGTRILENPSLSQKTVIIHPATSFLKFWTSISGGEK